MFAKNSHVGEIGEGESEVRWWDRREEWKCAVYSVQCNGYNLIGVTTVERGDGSYDNTSLFNITYAYI